MELLQYNNKKISLVDIDDEIWTGTVYYCDADTNETSEDVLVVKNERGYTEISESEIKSIEII
ncbi:TPA: hypothetical protein ACIZ2N_000602 [Streptococcus agalactiae]